MYLTDLTTSEVTERLTEELHAIPLDDFIDALEAALQERQAGAQPGEEAFRNLATSLRDLKARDYAPCDEEVPEPSVQ